MDTTRVVRTVSMLAVLVLVLGVAGAFADGVTPSRHDDSLITSNTFHSLSPTADSHVGFAVESARPSNGIRQGYLLRMSLLGNPKSDLVSNPPPPTSTPEPGTLLMLAAGLGVLVVGWRQRASQS
ncbi:MAG TPA: PEP-CTERM sorting domain-containing protein [Candidatus Acidoferrum sp.]|nr:PEP-CTERM sorting domain-containing protein [Candidatus Acidoferrum sp.]